MQKSELEVIKNQSSDSRCANETHTRKNRVVTDSNRRKIRKWKVQRQSERLLKKTKYSRKTP